MNPNPATYTVEDEITLQPPTKPESMFFGWKGGAADATGIPLGSTGNKTFTAQWVSGLYERVWNENDNKYEYLPLPTDVYVAYEITTEQEALDKLPETGDGDYYVKMEGSVDNYVLITSLGGWSFVDTYDAETPGPYAVRGTLPYRVVRQVQLMVGLLYKGRERRK